MSRLTHSSSQSSPPVLSSSSTFLISGGNDKCEPKSSGFMFVNPVTPKHIQMSSRACREVRNGSHTFTIPAPSPKSIGSPENDENEEAVLVLETFQRPPIVNFNKVSLGDTKIKSFTVYNPAYVEQTITADKFPKPDSGFELKESSLTISPEARSHLTVSWKPKQVGGVREKIRFVTSFGEKFEAILYGVAFKKAPVKKRSKPLWSARKGRLGHRIHDQMKGDKQTQTSPDFTATPMIIEINEKLVNSAKPELSPDIIPDPAATIQKLLDEETKQVHSALTIQRCFRGYIVRKQLKKMREAAIIIQKYWRGYAVRRGPTRRITFVIKPAVKRNIYTKYMEDAAIKIQRFYRAYKTRKEFEKKNQSAVVIQKAWRFYCAQKQEAMERERERKLKAALTIQKFFKYYLAKKRAENDYEAKHQACTIIQSTYRGYLVRKEIKELNAKAAIIQKYFRTYLVRKNYQERKAAILAACITIQSQFRGLKVRREIAKLQRSAVIVQKIWRGYYARRQVALIKSLAEIEKKEKAALVIQKFYRGYLARRKFAEIQLVTLKACITLQRWYRGYAVRKQIRTFHRCAVIIQKFWKGYAVRKQFELKKSQTNLRKSVMEFQRLCRGYLVRKKLLKIQQDRTSACLVIQRVYRGFKIRQELKKLHQNATTIQKIWKGYKVRQEIKKSHKAATTIQKSWRGYKARRNIKKLNESALFIQKFWRSYKARQEVKKHQAAIKIQKLWRGHKTRQNIKELHKSALIIQKNWRGYRTRRNIKKLHQAATNIQKIWKGYLARKWLKYLKSESEAKRLEMTKNHEEKVKACLTIQRYYRGYRARKELEIFNRQAIIIQKAWKGYLARKHFKFLNKLTKSNKQREQAAITIQKYLRGFMARITIEKMREDTLKACIVIQKYYRGYKTRKEMKLRQKSATIIQKAWKEFLTRKRFEESNVTCSLGSQSYGSCYSIEDDSESFEEIEKKINAAITIQRYYRKYAEQKQAKNREIEILKACSTIQRVWRGYKVRKELKKLHQYATVIQKMWRGYIVRKYSPILTNRKHSIITPIEIKLSHEESLHVKDTPNLPLGFRTDIAFKKLINYRKFYQLQTALVSLYTTTKISPDSCLKIADSIDTLIEIIRQSNRSEPSKDVVYHAFSILLNLIKYEKTQDLLITRPYIINVCIEKAKVHHKTDPIFNKCLTLIYLMVIKSPNRKAIISDSQIIKTLTSLIKLESSCIRSHKKHKTLKEIVFYPYWSSAKNVQYEFTDRFIALEHINHLFNGQLF